jgi:hypothetical protein
MYITDLQPTVYLSATLQPGQWLGTESESRGGDYLRQSMQMPTMRRLSVVSVCAAHGCIMFTLARALDVLVAARADACLSPQSRFTPGSLQSPPG